MRGPMARLVRLALICACLSLHAARCSQGLGRWHNQEQAVGAAWLAGNNAGAWRARARRALEGRLGVVATQQLMTKRAAHPFQVLPLHQHRARSALNPTRMCAAGHLPGNLRGRRPGPRQPAGRRAHGTLRRAAYVRAALGRHRRRLAAQLRAGLGAARGRAAASADQRRWWRRHCHLRGRCSAAGVRGSRAAAGACAWRRPGRSVALQLLRLGPR